MSIVEVKNFRKVYGDIVAVDNVSFEVEAGTIFGMVGPNGAGKTTTIECIEGLRSVDGGTIKVLGLNPQSDGYALRERIGMQLQESALPERIKVWEVLDLYASFYEKPIDWNSLIEQFGLVDKRNTYFTKLSGGLKQRLYIAMALLNNPELIFLDELTTGLDPQARITMWELVLNIRNQGKTVFLTTHYMEEAERLCDIVAIIDHGNIIAMDTPENLIRNLEIDTRIIFSLTSSFAVDSLHSLNGINRVEQSGERIIIYGRGDNLVADVVNLLTTKGAKFHNLKTEQPTLDDVFLTLTGREMRD